jgi:hypothetical protein
VGRYLELADEALRRAEPTPSTRREIPTSSPAEPTEAPPRPSERRYRAGDDACSVCGRTDWIASLVMDDGTRICARCCLGPGPR